MTIRYGIIGTGWITEAFLAGAAGVPGMALRAVCSRSEERGREFATRHGADLVFTDPVRMAASPDIDAVYIASPNVLHAAQSRLFLENGKHVLCEKPLAARPEEVESLQALAANRGLVYMEAIMLLHMPQLAVLEDAVGRLGRISLAHFDFSQLSSKYPAYLEGAALPNIFNPAMETGALMDLGVYCVYPALYLFGEPEGLTASAVFLDSGADGAGAAVLRYPDKVAVLTYSKTGQAAAPSQIVGDRGTLTIGSISKLEDMVLTEKGKAPERLVGEQDKAALMGYEAARFCAAVGAGEADGRGDEDSRLALRVHRCMREIRQQAGIVFPMDRDKGEPRRRPEGLPPEDRKI